MSTADISTSDKIKKYRDNMSMADISTSNKIKRYREIKEYCETIESNLLNRIQKSEFKIPDHLKSGIVAYVAKGQRPGHFLSAVFCNDLFGAMKMADGTSRDAIHSITMLIYNVFPAECHGSEKAFEKWLEQNGLIGRMKNEP
jgi:hypothetical protein